MISTGSKHVVEAQDSRRNSLAGGVMAKMGRGNGKYADALFIDQKRIFVRAMRRAAVFHDAQETGGDLVLHAIVKKNDAVRHILLQPVARQLTLATFAGDDCGDVSFLEPCEQAAKLAAHNRGIGQSREQVLDGIEHDPFCADGIDRITKPDKKPFQIERALPRFRRVRL